MIKTAIEALDFLAQLGREKVISYLAENKTISDIVDDLLEYQLLTPAIEKGEIAGVYADLTRSIQADGDSILGVLLKLRDTVGGYLEVDNDGDLNWAESIGEDKGQQIRYRKNLVGIERDIDYSSLVNRLYAYGEGEGEARITLSDADGQEEDYVEDTDSQTEWGGIYVGVEVDRSITSPDTLLAWATLRLAELKNPPISYRVDSVDLSKQTDVDFSFDSLQLGSTVTVIDEDLGINVSVKVVRIEHPDLSEPQIMILELATRTKDITDTLAEVYDAKQLQDHLATKIGAGQVIVLGEFTVKDWVTEGETTIKGDVIRTGIIQSENWPTSGAWLDLTNGLMKLGPSADPFLYWDGATLHLKGDFEVEGYIEVGGAAADVNAGVTTIAGGKITANTITATQLSTGEIITVSAQIKNAIITDAKIASLNAEKITAGYLSAARIEAGSITNVKILSVAFAKITDVEITNAMIESLAVSKITAGTLNAAITLSGSIIVTGSISAAAGDIQLDPQGIKLYGERLKLYDPIGGLTGVIGCSSTAVYLHGAQVGDDAEVAGEEVRIIADENVIVYAGTGYGINLVNCDFMHVPSKSSAPGTSEGRMYFNTDDKKLYLYTTLGGTTKWWTFQMA